MFKIDKNIPLPIEPQDAEKYPFKQMEIGDSFIATQDPKEWDLVVEEVIERNNVSDNLFLKWGFTDHDLRVWRVSVEDHLIDHPRESEALQFMLKYLSENYGKDITRSHLTQRKLNTPQSGSRSKREKVLVKYAFYFKISSTRNGGSYYEIA